MYTLRVATPIAAPPRRCFDLARSVDAHLRSAGPTGERAVAGRTAGLLGSGDEVTWEARHLGLTHRLTSRITAFRPPAYFQDRMTRGPFRFLEHDHHFEPAGDDGAATVMVDVLRFRAPFGPVGWLVERILLGPHLRRFLRHRGLVLKAIAESDDWRRYVPAPPPPM